jgi:hypothetical protein
MADSRPPATIRREIWNNRFTSTLAGRSAQIAVVTQCLTERLNLTRSLFEDQRDV